MKQVKETALWTALVTPMQTDGRVDFESLEFVVRKQEEAGNGILLLGSTGEGLALNEVEKRSVVRFVSQMNPSVPLMAGVGGFCLETQQRWMEFCSTFDVDAYLLVAPLYSKPGPIGMKIWFESLMYSVDRPCMLYNIPGRTGVKIPPSVVAELASHPNLWSLKEASGQAQEYRAFRESAPDIAIYSGDDAHLPVYAEIGCSGLVSVAANVWPLATSCYVERTLAGESDSFRELWEQASRALFCASNPIPAKSLLFEKGWIRHATLRLPLTEKDLKDYTPLIEADRAVTQWYNSL